MDAQKLDIKALMLAHLTELMADAELYGWEAIRAFHAVWLQQMEQKWVTWKDADIKLSFRCASVCYQPAPTCQQPAAASLAACKPTKTTTPFNVTAKPGSKVCQAYNRGGYASADQHPKDLHVCVYCLGCNRHCGSTSQF